MKLQELKQAIIETMEIEEMDSRKPEARYARVLFIGLAIKQYPWFTAKGLSEKMGWNQINARSKLLKYYELKDESWFQELEKEVLK